ncbi:amidohydrolase family protein [Kribbella capetownensis]|nr:amidohydrolase family protein [Kribbella capetownensis]
MTGLIDVHSHFLLPEYVAAAERAGHLRPDGMPGWPEWSVRKQLDLMDQNEIATALLSVSSPGVHFGDDFRAQVLARRMNEAAAELGRDHPGRFGSFASLPLPDVEGALVELNYAYDVLHADGVVLMSNAGGQYPGEPSWEPLWQALNDRSAVVLLHPTSPPQWRQVSLDRPRPMIEFVFDSARAVTDLALTGVFARYLGIRFIVSPAGALPMIADRLDLFQSTFTPPSGGLPSVASQLHTLWYDAAGAPPPDSADRLVFGSGYCFTPTDAVSRQIASLDVAVPGWREHANTNASELISARAHSRART